MFLQKFFKKFSKKHHQIFFQTTNPSSNFSSKFGQFHHSCCVVFIIMRFVLFLLFPHRFTKFFQIITAIFWFSQRFTNLKKFSRYFLWIFTFFYIFSHFFFKIVFQFLRFFFYFLNIKRTFDHFFQISTALYLIKKNWKNFPMYHTQLKKTITQSF